MLIVLNLEKSTSPLCLVVVLIIMLNQLINIVAFLKPFTTGCLSVIRTC